MDERRSITGLMTEPQFREFTMNSFEDGHRRFDELQRQIHTNFELMSQAIGENTVHTMRAADTSEKALRIAETTEQNTAGIVALYDGAGKVKDTAMTGTKKLSRLSKTIMPILVLVAVLTLMFRGEPLVWKDVLAMVIK